ncbi:MAG TPA: nuclear transport factor 2 family protein [Thermoleophilaceae bacterium]|jgi:ketosteroid isomerase-like protein|nr:nuclear transport factor 2 family protein [Thermoleophilaceae bacterium]
MSRENLELLQRGFERWNAGDLEAALEVVADDMRWYPGSVFLDDDELYEGKQGMRDYFASFEEPWEWIMVEPLEQEEIGDHIAVRARFRARSNEGVDVDIQVGQRWTFRHGLLIEFHGYPSYAEAVEAARGAP